MQRSAVIALALFALTLAAPQQQQQQQQQQDPSQVYILRHDSVVGPDGYQFAFDTSDGTSRQEQGTLKQISEDHQAIEVSGSYRYVAPDGLTYIVNFTADENGYKPQEHVEHQQ